MAHQWNDDTTLTAPPAAPPVEQYSVEVGRPGPTGHVSLFLPQVVEGDGSPRPLVFTPTQARDLWRALDALMQPATGSDPDDASTSAEVGLRAVRDLLAKAPDAACDEVAAYAAAQARAAHLAPGPAAFHAWLQAAANGKPEP
jgi:hypothetical protein